MKTGLRCLLSAALLAMGACPSAQAGWVRIEVHPVPPAGHTTTTAGAARNWDAHVPLNNRISVRDKSLYRLMSDEQDLIQKHGIQQPDPFALSKSDGTTPATSRCDPKQAGSLTAQQRLNCPALGYPQIRKWPTSDDCTRVPTVKAVDGKLFAFVSNVCQQRLLQLPSPTFQLIHSRDGQPFLGLVK
jgi:hypothetical protein